MDRGRCEDYRLQSQRGIYTVTTQNGAAVEIDGGSVLTGTNMDALAILAGGGDISARNCTVDSEAIFEHEDALGVVTLNG